MNDLVRKDFSKFQVNFFLNPLKNVSKFSIQEKICPPNSSPDYVQGHIQEFFGIFSNHDLF